jgi:hypothetical protein
MADPGMTVQKSIMFLVPSTVWLGQNPRQTPFRGKAER